MNRRSRFFLLLAVSLALSSSLHTVFHMLLITNNATRTTSENQFAGGEMPDRPYRNNIDEGTSPRASTNDKNFPHDRHRRHFNTSAERFTEEEEDDDTDDADTDDGDDPFATQNPRGERWTSPSSFEQRDDNAKKFWWRNSNSCFEVDQICRRSSSSSSSGSSPSPHRNNNNHRHHEWFYYYHNESSSSPSSLIQPSFELKYVPYSYRKAVWADARIKLTARSNSRVSWEGLVRRRQSGGGSSRRDDYCRVSPTAHHVVLQSVFDDMVGEFYVRILLNLYALLATANNDNRTSSTMHDNNHHHHHHNTTTKTVVTTTSSNFDTIDQTSTQFYLHIPLENKKMLDAHKLFLMGIMPNLKRWAKSAIELVRPPPSPPLPDHRHRNERASSSSSSCQCFRKLVFCGYNIYLETNNDNDRSSSSNGGSVHHRNDTRIFNNNHASSSSPPPSSSSRNEIETNYTLWPGKYIDAYGRNVAESPAACDPVTSRFTEPPHRCEAYSKLRTHLVANLEGRYFANNNNNNNTTMEESSVQRYRRDVLLLRKMVDASYGGDTKEWTFVGLAQRTTRRSWINLGDVMDACDNAFPDNNNNNETKDGEDPKKVICVEVNVENATSPEEQFMLHRTLDALVGVHGAQLTQAILLPRNAHVLELLPWVPEYTRGDWVQTTRHPTPLGIIFHNSQLNHYGYSLNRSSVVLCQNASKEEEKGCFTHKETEWKFAWDNRNFIIDADVVIQFVNTFVLPMRNPCRCEDLRNARQDGFTLYNIWCVDDVESGTNTIAKPVVRHYYRDAESNTEIAQSKQERSPLDRCPLPMNDPTWNYYNALVDENFHTAYRAKGLTSSIISLGSETERRDESKARIPHRLIFTHKDNLLDCSKSASASTSPDLYNFAENTKATIRAYSKIWPDLEYIFLTDEDCLEALNQTEPFLIPWFNSGLAGMYKADLCRAAYLFLHGGYYFDVDILVVRPFVAPNSTKFITVKGDGFPRDGFFQAFLAAEKGNAIVYRSIKIMLDTLYGERPQGKYLGPTALMEAWMEVNNITNPSAVNYNEQKANGVYLLNEVNMNAGRSISNYKKISNVIAAEGGMALYQHIPTGHGDHCKFSGGACNVVVIDELDETLYFYSRILGTTWCGKKVHEEGECTTEGDLLKRISDSESGS